MKKIFLVGIVMLNTTQAMQDVNTPKSNGDLEKKDWWGRTPLERAIDERDVDKMQKLIGGGAKVNIRGSDGCTPLLRAVLSNMPQHSDWCGKEGRVCHWCSPGGELGRVNVKSVELLLKEGAKVQVSGRGLPPLQRAVFRAAGEARRLRERQHRRKRKRESWPLESPDPLPPRYILDVIDCLIKYGASEKYKWGEYVETILDSNDISRTFQDYLKVRYKK